MTDLITDRRALQPEYIPQDLSHRDGHIDALAAALEPLVDGHAGEHTCIFGPSGSGKTTLARYVAAQLTESAPHVTKAYVNCFNSATTTGTLATLVRDAGLGSRRSESASRRYYLDQLRAETGPILAILDEVKALPSPDILRALYAIERVTLVCIGVDEETLFVSQDLDSQTRSRLRTFEIVRLTAYTQRELVDILEYRVAHGLNTNRVQADAIEYIAERAAGDARAALMLLRRAARQAERTGDPLDAALVDTVRDGAIDAQRTRRVESLGTHQRVLYELVKAAGADGIGAAELHQQYESRVGTPRSKRARRRHLDELEQNALIETSGDGRGRRYRLAR